MGVSSRKSVSFLPVWVFLLGLAWSAAAEEPQPFGRWGGLLRNPDAAAKVKWADLLRNAQTGRAGGFRLQTLRGMAEARKQLLVLPEFEGLAVPNNTASLAWLRNYFATTYGSWGPDWNHTEWGDLPAAPCLSNSGERSRVPADSVLSRDGRPAKRSLILALVGDTWWPGKWLSNVTAAEFDLGVVYIGQHPQTFTCPECAHIWRMRGLKWQVIQRVSSSPKWDEIAAEYDYVMFADDDLVMQTCDLNILFRIMSEYQLMLAQPSLCNGSVSWVAHFLTQRPDTLLRYSTFVEIMAPTFDMGFFTNVVRHTFFTGISGYGFGADHLWPALLRYPRRGVAVIDAVCIMHPKRVSGSIYEIRTTFPQPNKEADILNALTRYRSFRREHDGDMQELSAVRLRKTGEARQLQQYYHQQQGGLRWFGSRRGSGKPVDLLASWRNQPAFLSGEATIMLTGAVGAAAVFLLKVSVTRKRLMRAPSGKLGQPGSPVYHRRRSWLDIFSQLAARSRHTRSVL